MRLCDIFESPEQGYHVKNHPVYGKVLAKDGQTVVADSDAAAQLADQYRGSLIKSMDGKRYIIKMSEAPPHAINEASGHIPQDDKEARDPRWSNALTVDIRPGEDTRQAAKLGWNVKGGRPPKLDPSGKI